MAADGQVDPWAHFVNAYLLDRYGNRIDRRNAQDIAVALQATPTRVEAIGVPRRVLERYGPPERHDEELGLTVAALTDDVSQGALREAAFLADAGISSVDYGVAETGTLALLARPGQGRSVSLLPPVHIAVLDANDVVAELAAFFERVTADGELPSALTFITGPSRTGDIELVLTVGVHGPKEIHLIILEGTS